MRYTEGIAIKDSREDINDVPDLLYIIYKYIIVFNDHRHEILLLEMAGEGEASTLDRIEKAIRDRNYTAYDFRATGPVTSNLTDGEHRANIRSGIAHCLRGDVFQIVLSMSDGQVMAIRHREYDIRGVQFHPESVLTPDGKAILRNWIKGMEA